MTKLTKRVADAAKPADKDYFIWDDEMPGYGLRVLPSGKKSYMVQYRAKGRTRRVTFGRYGKMTADEARVKARGLLSAVDHGEDPAADIKGQRQAMTVAEVSQRFLTEHVANRCKPVTEREYRRAIDLHIRPKIGTRRVTDIARSDIQMLHNDFRDTPYQANRALSVLSKMFNLCEAWGLRPDGSNPCRHIKKYPEQKRQRYLSGAELKRLGETLAEYEKRGSEAKAAATCLRLLLLTGCRLGEIQTLKWSYVAADRIHLPDSKTGAKTVYLGQAARDVLAGIERQADNEYVIAGKKAGAHLTDMQRPWRCIREIAELDDVRIHDLRHSFASIAVGGGEALPMIGKLLGHSQVQTTARYAHLADDPVKAAAERISNEIAGAIFGR